MSENRNKKIFAGSMAAVLLLGASSLAWFTDRTEGSIEGQAGNLCIELSDIEADLGHLAPGDRENVKFEYTNLGSLAMDTRITYALSYELDEEVANAIESDLDKIATLTVGEDELVLTADSQYVSGTFESDTLKGSKEDIGSDVIKESIEFHFDESVGNIGQKMKFKLDVLVEGKQNRNSPTWDEVHKTTIHFGDDELEVTPTSACNTVDDEQYGSVYIVFDEDAKQKINKFTDDHNINKAMEVKIDLMEEYFPDDYEKDPYYTVESKTINIDNLDDIDVTNLLSDWLTDEEMLDSEYGHKIRIHVALEDSHSTDEGYILLMKPVDKSIYAASNAFDEGERHDFVIDGSTVQVVRYT